jgi:hypothetical protein
MPLVFVWIFIGLAAAFQDLAPTLYAGAAPEQPVLLAQPASSQSQKVRDPATRNIDDGSGILPPNGCATTPVSQRDRGISRAKNRTGWNVN